MVMNHDLFSNFIRHKTQGSAPLFWGLVAIPLLLMLIAGGGVLYLAMQNINNGVYSTHLEIARRANFAIAQSLEAVVREMEQTTYKLTQNQDPNKVLALLLKENPEFERASYIDMSGQEVMRVDRSVLVIKQDFRDLSKDPGWRRASVGRIFFSNMFYSEQGEPNISVFIPVHSVRDDIVGVEKVDLNLKFLWSLMGDIEVGERGKVYVVDAQGFPVADPDPSFVLRRENMFARSVIKHAFEVGQADSLDPRDRYRNSINEEVFSVGLLIPSIKWIVVTEEPSDDAFVASRTVLFAGVAFLVIAIILMVLLILGLRRILLLTNFADKLRLEVEKRTKELSEKVSDLNSANEELDREASLLSARDEELSSANKHLQELDKLKSEFISIAAHQLRTPLSAIKWVFSVLMEGHLGALVAEQKSYLMKGEESTTRMIHLVDALLAVTRIESGMEEYKFFMLPFDDVVKNIVLELAQHAKESGVEISFHMEGNAHTSAMVDPDKIGFVFENLIDNAIKYTPKGGTIKVTLGEGENDTLLVMIADTGMGIPPDEQGNIFAKFYRASNAVKTVTDGNGLGLFVAKHIIENHGGTITFESALGMGTVFRISIPRLHPSAASVPLTTAST